MNIEETLKLMRKREKRLKAILQVNLKEAERLQYKSRRIRLSSPIIPRIGFFTDRLQELQLAIRLLTGKVDSDYYIKYQMEDWAFISKILS